MEGIDFRAPEYYTNRELSWLLFDERVLEEATDEENPLFERLKFLGITASNLDEYFMVRVASLKDMVHAQVYKKDISGMTPKEQLFAVNEATHDFVKSQYGVYDELVRLLEKEGIGIISAHEKLDQQP